MLPMVHVDIVDMTAQQPVGGAGRSTVDDGELATIAPEASV